MEEQSAGQRAADAVGAALRKKEKEDAHLESVLKAFGKTLVEQVRWKADLAPHDDLSISEPDPELFAKGIPVSSRKQLIRIGELWPAAANLITPSLQEGFPLLAADLARMSTAVLDGSFSPDLFLSAAYGGRTDEARTIAGHIGFEPELLTFVLTQLAAPVVAKRSEMLFPLVRELPWNRGYCPICGSFPELSLLKGKEGQRWLRCGFCAAIWRFYRGSCPFCDSRDSGDVEFFFVEGRDHERVEVCHRCGRYITGMDLRSFGDDLVEEVLHISLMHLDVIAQKAGFLPMKGMGWESPGKEGSSKSL
ncbi:MAG: formate dehydrogenase accessory protein FdhE [Desulfobacteraceae bacterium]|nr:formate dehydrogenase accessory protein FdhE [Desulfobacteraceae bacterium]